MRDVDAHFASAPLPVNLPALLGLLNVWNATFLGHSTTALLPYQEALQVRGRAGWVEGWGTFLGHSTTAPLPYQQARGERTG